MLKITGAALVIFACGALGYGKSAGISARLSLLREIEKMLLLLMGEITYRKEAQWYLQQLKTEIDTLAGEMPVKKKLYRSLGILSGIFLAILLL